MGQASAAAPAPCTKTISFAIAEGGQPVPAIPKFAAKWIGKMKHIAGYPELCLAQIPSTNTVNYLVIFSTSESSFDGLTPSAHTYTSKGPLAGNLASSSYGGTWNYSYMGTGPVATTSSIDLQHVDSSRKMLAVRAYDQQGRQLSRYSVDEGHTRERLLDQVFADIHRDSGETRYTKTLAAPLSVYYVNCDVDSPVPASLAATSERPVSQAAPTPTPPIATLSLWSNPAGADIYLDGGYVAKTPYTITVAPGEHIVVLRKPEFGIWQTKFRAAAGPRRVGAYLERRL